LKPDPDVSGVPYNFDALPMKISPDLWDETKRMRLRGLWFVLLYTLSVLVFGSLFLFPLALVFDKPIILTAWIWLSLCTPAGIILGCIAWWDFTRKCTKLLENKESVK
jgi:hypothetical protein